ncbi:hypothetical protein Droror1_Dr00000608 [Drosera rotundifolia]
MREPYLQIKLKKQPPHLSYQSPPQTSTLFQSCHEEQNLPLKEARGGTRRIWADLYRIWNLPGGGGTMPDELGGGTRRRNWATTAAAKEGRGELGDGGERESERGGELG